MQPADLVLGQEYVAWRERVSTNEVKHESTCPRSQDLHQVVHQRHTALSAGMHLANGRESRPALLIGPLPETSRQRAYRQRKRYAMIWDNNHAHCYSGYHSRMEESLIMDNRRPFRFGIQQYRAASGDAWRETARRAESLGYDILVIPDHIGQGVLAYAPALMSIAEATTTLRIGTLVLDNDFRHPALVASEATTLDVLSEGRFELGIGAGWDRADYDVSGIPFDAPKVRVGRLEESIQIVKRLFSDTPVTFDGQHYTVRDLTNAPPPVQQPHPPILVGGGGQRMLAIAAREADIVSVMPPGVSSGAMPDLRASSMRRGVDHVREVAGNRFAHIELNTLLQRLVITGNARQATDELAQQWQITEAEARDTPWALIGTVDQIVDMLHERRERFGLSYWVVQDRFMEAFAPVVARLAGS